MIQSVLRCLLMVCVLLLVSLLASAQKTTTTQRCGTMEYLQNRYNRNPALKLQYEQNLLQAEKLKEAYLKQKITQTGNTENFDIQTLAATVYVPVIVHIILPNAEQVSDADVKVQIDKLNTDYAGLNADSINLPPAFKALFGKSKIQFKLARRDPNGNLSTGIERRNSSAASNINLSSDPIKSSAAGGLDAWDFTKYLNLWVGLDASGLGVLGYATFPGTDLPANEGVFINAQSWGSNACYVITQFGLGRTLVHEVGHYFGLYHIWGDDGSGCTGDDFRQLAGTCLLPASLLLGDTPNQAGSNSGLCPSGVKTDACTVSAPGVMYQNYMDYTNDACYAMFTSEQVARMEWTMENCRTSYLTSDGAIPPPGAPQKDVSPTAVVNPGGFEISGCTLISYPNIACANSVQPKVRITNKGIDTLTSFIAGLIINGVSQGEQTISSLMALGYSQVVTFPIYNFTNGAYTLKYYTKQPNTTADEVSSNDTLTVTFIVGLIVTGAITEGFEAAAFPSTGWKVINPNAGSLTWTKNNSVAKTGTASAFINFFNYQSVRGHLDYLVAPMLDVTGADSILVNFDRAYRPFSNTTTTFVDTLLIQASVDCGNSFPIVAWKKGGSELATNPAGINTEYTPVATDWKNETVDIKPFIGNADKINIAFVGKNGYGQNLYLDNVNIRTVKLLHRDATVSRVTEPYSRLCARTFVPIAEIRNNGIDTLKTLKVSYSLNGATPVTINYTGSLGFNNFIAISFPAVTISSAGNNNIKFFTSDPNGLTDEVLLNDTLNAIFTVFDPVQSPVKEGFEQPTFPPANWSLVKSNINYTWQRNTGGSTEGVASAWIRNYKNTSSRVIDELYSPLIQLTAPDSVFVDFDIAYVIAKYPGTSVFNLDTVEVLLTKDCGKTFNSVYKKWGGTLQTTGDPNFPVEYAASDTIGFVPTAKNQWRNETINLSNLLAGVTGTFQLAFRNINSNGNNIFLDNINIRSQLLPARLKQQGYLITPNPNEGFIYIQHYQVPTNLKAIQIFNSTGQLIIHQPYRGAALALVRLDLSRYAAGIYTVKMLYDDKVVTQQIFKIK
jgi:Pregnancy-associated plasma protein-A/Secretion system C-terminal sorting domain/CARDB